MNTKYRMVSASSLMTLLLATLSCDVNGQFADEQAEQQARMKNFPAYGMFAFEETGPRNMMCGVVVEVDEPTTAHLKLGHRLFLHGPFPDGNFRVEPAGANPSKTTEANPWNPGIYWALNISAQPYPAPQEFILSSVRVVVSGVHSNPGYDHDYKMVIERFEPEGSWCAKEVTLRTGFHPSETGDDHGGDVHLIY